MKWIGPLFAIAPLAVGCATSPVDTDDEPSKAEVAAAMSDGTADVSVDWCETLGWYDDGECDRFCLSFDWDCPAADLLFPDPVGEPASYPIVLTHGFMGSTTNIWSFYQVADALRADGHQVYEAEVPAFDSSEVRALALADHIDTALEDTGADRAHLIAHSMGGLDARIVASPLGLGYGDRLASVTTIGTAHRGTILADAYLGLVPGFADVAFDTVVEFLGDRVLDTAEADARMRGAMESLAGIAHPEVLGKSSTITDFREAYPDAPGLYYQSWAGVSNIFGRAQDVSEACDDKVFMHEGTANATHVLLYNASALAVFEDGPHDGMISVESTKYGEFKGCVPADHLDQVGQPSHDTSDPKTGFNHLGWYRTIAYDLAARE